MTTPIPEEGQMTPLERIEQDIKNALKFLAENTFVISKENFPEGIKQKKDYHEFQVVDACESIIAHRKMFDDALVEWNGFTGEQKEKANQILSENFGNLGKKIIDQIRLDFGNCASVLGNVLAQRQQILQAASNFKYHTERISALKKL